MQQQAAAQVPTPTGTRAAIEGQQDAWWLDKQMKVGRSRLVWKTRVWQQKMKTSRLQLVHALPSRASETPGGKLSSVTGSHIVVQATLEYIFTNLVIPTKMCVAIKDQQDA